MAAGEGLQPPLNILGYKTSTTTMNRDSSWCRPFDISLRIYPKVPGLFTSRVENSVDPYELASEKPADLSLYTIFQLASQKPVYLDTHYFPNRI